MADSWFLDQESSKISLNASPERSAGNRINPGPYIGIVKNVVDPLYSGVLQVYIPELGGDPTSKTSWKNMMYATPFYGRTNIQDPNSMDGAPHSYGMWFVPPDIDNKVLCIFANGDPAKGYWFACIPDWPALHMVPGISAPVDGSNVEPVVDFYDEKTNTPANDPKLANVRTLDKLTHTYQRKIWYDQGLLQDPDRGPGRSSAQRETPSAVFGISTPGRPIDKNDPQLYPDDVGYTSAGTTQKSPGQLMGVHGRRGGHTFVMDDGDSEGNNQMFRLRSAAGHMILMNDTKEFIYIINSAGTSWIEMNKDGAINIYAQSQMNITAKEGFSLETAGSLKMKGKTVDIVAENNLNIQAADINVLGSGSTKIAGKQSLHLHSKKNSYLTGESCIQIKADGHIDLKGACHTINTADANKATEASEAKSPDKMPTKEPFGGHSAAGSKTSSPTYGSNNNQVKGSSGKYGATKNFGSGSAQENYGNQTNNVSPVVYNDGPQGSLEGQGSTAGSYRPPNYNGGGVSWTAVGAVAGAVAGLVFGGGSSYDVSDSNAPRLSVGESQNNPGNLPYNDSDRFAVGYNNNLAVYTKPESGIAALALLFDSLNTSSTTRSIDIIQGFLNAQSNSDPRVIDMTRYMHNNLGIVADDYVALYDPNTRLGWVAYAIQYIQGRLIYTYDQVVGGCAMSLGLSVTDFLQGIQPLTKPWQNNNGYNPLSGFVNPASNNNIVQRGNSPLQMIGSALTGGVVGGLIGSLFDSSQQQEQNNTTQQGEIIQVSSIQSARRYLESNPDTPGGTVFAYPDGSTFTLGGGNASITSPIPGVVENGVVYGNGQCAALAQSNIDNFGTMSSIQYGNRVLDNPPAVGTIIVTGNFRNPDGTLAYGPSNAPGGVSGYSHTAAYLGQGSDERGQYIVVQDQWAGRACGVRKIYNDGSLEGADKFYVAKSAANGYDSNGVRLPNSENYNPENTVAPVASGNPTPGIPLQDTTPVGDTTEGSRNLVATNPKNSQYYDPPENVAATVQTNKTENAVIEREYIDLQEKYNYGTVEPVPNTDFIPQGYDIAPTVGSYNVYGERDSASSNFVVADNFDSASQVSRLSGDGNLGITAPEPASGDLLINKNLGLQPPDAADAPLAITNEVVYDARTGEVVQIGSSKTAVNPTFAPDVAATNGVRPQYDPTTGQLINQPITGANKAPGTGGQSGGQKTPQGSSQTGAGGKSC